MWFSIDPLILVITLQDRKTLFCVFLSFRDLPRLKLTFGALVFYHEKHQEKELTIWGLGAERARVARVPDRAHHPMPSRPRASAAVHLRVQTLILTKKCLYIDPLDDRDEGRRRNTKHRHGGCSSKHWRGKRSRSRPRRLSTLSDVNTIITAMKRE
jgi:hypothetical protein